MTTTSMSETEATELEQMQVTVVRLARSLEQATCDRERLTILWNMHAGVDCMVRRVARGAHDEGLSWAEIGQLFGVSKQAAWERWSKAAQ